MKRLWLILLLWISSLLGQTINIITSEAINSGSFQTVTEILQGRVPGLIGANLEGQGAARIRFRGTISMLRRNSPIIFVDNVRQEPTIAYSVSGATLTFTEAPPTGTNNVYVVHTSEIAASVLINSF